MATKLSRGERSFSLKKGEPDTQNEGTVTGHFQTIKCQDTRHRPVRWLVSGLVWTGWCWFIVREKHCSLVGLGWLNPTSEQAV